MWSCACAGSPILAKSHSNPIRRRLEMMSLQWYLWSREADGEGDQQPRPVACSSCESNGHVECKWCGGTGFFILGDNMLRQVPSRNTSCVICAGKGSTCCSDCKGTGFRAKWLGEPPIPKSYSGDWSRIGVISRETEELLKITAYVVLPLCFFLIFSISKESEDA
ncbi:hypothetical protein Syun_001465 [Stephania yunnanensis]|uniref:DUF7887 domain-containing protein n=1 Tax=Stephania yunnanensis TaxID=152371 RepID=A0AAP0LET0_9MAGN